MQVSIQSVFFNRFSFTSSQCAFCPFNDIENRLLRSNQRSIQTGEKRTKKKPTKHWELSGNIKRQFASQISLIWKIMNCWVRFVSSIWWHIYGIQYDFCLQFFSPFFTPFSYILKRKRSVWPTISLKQLNVRGCDWHKTKRVSGSQKCKSSGERRWRKKWAARKFNMKVEKFAVADQLHARNPHFLMCKMAILWCLGTAVWSTNFNVGFIFGVFFFFWVFVTRSINVRHSNWT